MLSLPLTSLFVFNKKNFTYSRLALNLLLFKDDLEPPILLPSVPMTRITGLWRQVRFMRCGGLKSRVSCVLVKCFTNQVVSWACSRAPSENGKEETVAGLSCLFWKFPALSHVTPFSHMFVLISLSCKDTRHADLGAGPTTAGPCLTSLFLLE